jgi:hypothetical protein
MGPVHTAGNAVPPLDDDQAGLLDDLAGVHAGVDMIRDGIRHLALSRLSPSETQTVLYTLAGAEGLDVLTALAQLVQRLTNPDTNPALRGLDLPTQKEIQHHGELHAYDVADFDRQPIADAIGLIDH